ncbi:putative Ribose-phosphate pyrophosphokinase [Candidatus Protochlamydia naegleriophila]|uniref:ribose-phosphate diphosphokinase n=1 Tax=Candidatus Protochlamydia naegleriophila TaxID=389348 RepID=A0A0U5K6D7_9BACT|nr:ribose-phosphate diphosphokinase [Candidatus Protochlamydia naegleriophila]CUI17723.1 putative Ribose-phosphate pyrophosphokinase [Candidatus Protochlamydia naegleriophila]
MNVSASRLDPYVIMGFENDTLAHETAHILGKELVPIKNSQFNDTSSNVQIEMKDKHGLENKRVYLIAGNCRKESKSVNDTSMEIFLAIDAAKQAGAKEINLYLPYLGYARQDKVSQAGEPIAASAILRMFACAGANKITVLDIHNDAVFGSLGTTIGINKFAMEEFAKRFKQKKENGIELGELIVVAPDKGAIDRSKLFLEAMKIAGFANTAFAYFDKSRDYAIKGHVQSMDLREVELSTGEVLIEEKAKEAFKGKTAIVVDDIADTCGTILRAISDNIVGRYEAKKAYAVITHGVFSGDALKKIADTKELAGMLVSDSIPLREQVPSNLEIVSSAPIFAEAIRLSIEM